MDLNIPPDQGALVRVGHSLDTKGVRNPGLAAVVDLDDEVFSHRAGRPDDSGRPGERGVRVLTAHTDADERRANGLGLYPYVRPMVVVLQVPCRRAALYHEAERGLRLEIGQIGDQSRHREEIPEGGEDGVALDLSLAGHLPRSRGYAADAWPVRGGRDEPVCGRCDNRLCRGCLPDHKATKRAFQSDAGCL